ncbi:MAG: nuclease-related domain-containing protein [Candidatus Pacebacteria bacterium]|nr:nuclease-related domain-containing protein [Candidatus Paceibacterota bacterium]
MVVTLAKGLERILNKRFKNNYMTWGRGAGAELVTQKHLGKLGCGYHIVNDFQYKYGNIDHICICQTGIFTIETKAHKGLISYNGRLLKDGKEIDKDFIFQAKSAAMYISEYIQSVLGKKYFVTPILVFNNAKIDSSIRGPRHGVWIGGKGFQNYVIANNKNLFLSEEEASAIYDILKKRQFGYHE